MAQATPLEIKRMAAAYAAQYGEDARREVDFPRRAACNCFNRYLGMVRYAVQPEATAAGIVMIMIGAPASSAEQMGDSIFSVASPAILRSAETILSAARSVH